LAEGSTFNYSTSLNLRLCTVLLVNLRDLLKFKCEYLRHHLIVQLHTYVTLGKATFIPALLYLGVHVMILPLEKDLFFIGK
jgi:hypothetical protein